VTHISVQLEYQRLDSDWGSLEEATFAAIRSCRSGNIAITELVDLVHGGGLATPVIFRILDNT
jgi:hypothetical protein